MGSIEQHFSSVNRRRRRLHIFFLAAGIFLCAGLLVTGVAWVLFRSPVFRIQSVSVEGERLVASSSVLDAVYASPALRSGWRSLFPVSNILAFPVEISGSDLPFSPAISFINVEKNILHRTVTLHVVERDALGVWCRQAAGRYEYEVCRLFDRNGKVFSKAPAVSGNVIRVVYDRIDAPLNLGDEVMPEASFITLRSILYAMDRVSVSSGIVRIADTALQEVSVEIPDGPTLLFSLRFPPDTAIVALQELIQDQSFNFMNRDTIDFRVQNRLFYK